MTHTLVGVPSGLLADRIGKEKVLLIGYSIFAVSNILMILLSGNVIYAYIIASAYGVYIGEEQHLASIILY